MTSKDTHLQQSTSHDDIPAPPDNGDAHEPGTHKAAGFAVSLRIRLGWLLLQRSKLGANIRHLGSWLETEAAAIAEQTNQSTIHIELNDDAAVRTLRIGPKKHPHDLQQCTELWRFLLSLGVSQIHLDARLESNQITDVLTLLHVLRRRIRKARSAGSNCEMVAGLSCEQGILIACTRTNLCGGKLTISYSYCVTCFSRMVHFFESRHNTFRDHRALFQAAPRVALIVGLIAAVPVLIFAAANRMWMLSIIAAVQGLALMVIMYLLFMIIGSVEYDSEEKSYRLGNAYGRLKTYADRITADTRRARTVQERILPNLAGISLSDHMEWAASFMPEAEVGGDYYDVQALDDDRVAILFSDVSGHGMAAAFITAILKTTFQNCVDSDSPLADLVEKLNSALCRLTPDDSFAAVFAAIYDASTRQLSYVNAGHHPEPWHLPVAGRGPIDTLSDARTMILGIKPDIEINVSNRTLESGDIVLMVSDGIIDNQNIDAEEYGLERLMALLQENRADGAATLVNTIAEQAQSFCTNSQQSDDRTILAFQVKS